MKKEDRGPVVVRPAGTDWVVPVGRDTDLSKCAESCLETIVRDEYRGEDPRFQGMSRLEATLLSLAEDAPHDPQARTELLDRVMGKPRQKVDTTSVNLTLTGFLREVAEKEKALPEEEMFR